MTFVNSIKRLAWWILYIPAAVILFPYVLGVVSRAEDWFFADPHFIESSRSVFLDRFNSVGELLSSMFPGVIFGLAGGIGGWLYDNHQQKKYAAELAAETEPKPNRNRKETK